LYVQERKKDDRNGKKHHSTTINMNSMMTQPKKTPMRNPLNLRRPESTLSQNRVKPENSWDVENINTISGTYPNIPTISVSDEYYPRYAWLD